MEATGAGGCLLCALTLAVPADAAPIALAPSVDCVAVSADGTLATAYFGYTNASGTSVNFAIGNFNEIIPGDPFGQPTTYNAGSYPSVFNVTFDPAISPSLSWILNGLSVTASASSPPCAPGTTAPASGVTDTAAALNGVVDPGGTDTTYNVRVRHHPRLRQLHHRRRRRQRRRGGTGPGGPDRPVTVDDLLLQARHRGQLPQQRRRYVPRHQRRPAAVVHHARGAGRHAAAARRNDPSHHVAARRHGRRRLLSGPVGDRGHHALHVAGQRLRAPPRPAAGRQDRRARQRAGDQPGRLPG